MYNPTIIAIATTIKLNMQYILYRLFSGCWSRSSVIIKLQTAEIMNIPMKIMNLRNINIASSCYWFMTQPDVWNQYQASPFSSLSVTHPMMEASNWFRRIIGCIFIRFVMCNIIIEYAFNSLKNKLLFVIRQYKCCIRIKQFSNFVYTNRALYIFIKCLAIRAIRAYILCINLLKSKSIHYTNYEQNRS